MTHPSPAATIETLVLERWLPAPVEAVYRAWTTRAELERWYTAEHGWIIAIHHHDPRVGGRFEVSFTPPVGDTIFEEDLYDAVVPNERLAFTMTLRRSNELISTTHVTVTFAHEGTGTKLTITDVGPSARDHEQGWTPALEELATLLATGA